MMTSQKRTDYRKTPAGDALGHYLLNGYLAGENYHPGGAAGLDWATQAQPHYTGREAGLWAKTEQGGIPAQKRRLINHLDGYSAREVRLAIDMVRMVDPLAIDALRWHQKAPALRESRYAWAADNHCSHQALSTRFRSAVRQVGEHLSHARAVLAGDYELTEEQREALGL